MRIVETGFIGMRNARNAILSGLLKIHRPEGMIFSVAHRGKMEAMTARTKMPHAGSNRECAKVAKYLTLVIEPQYFDAAFSEIRDMVTLKQVMISSAPGVMISNIIECSDGNVQVIRAMSNTPTMPGEGAIGTFCRESFYTEEEKEVMQDIFSPCGWAEMVEEQLMDAINCVSGSSPALAYIPTEALADGGIKYGLPRKTAYVMVVQTVLNSAKIILETGKRPGQLKDEVCSPGGITIAGMSALKEHRLRNALIKVTDVCYEKTQSMK